VTVRLYQGSTLVGTAVTDASGEYYFVYGAAPDGNTGDNIGQVNGGLLYNTSYQVRLDLAADYASGGPLFGRFLTSADATIQNGDDDASDSDAVYQVDPPGSPAGAFPVVGLTTGTPGMNNHTFDIGFSPIAPTAAHASVSGRVVSPNGLGLRNVQVSMLFADGTVRTAFTGSFGYYIFDEVPAGRTVILSVNSRRYNFPAPTRTVFVNEDIADVDFVADSHSRSR
jgi:hypothetical protein